MLPGSRVHAADTPTRVVGRAVLDNSTPPPTLYSSSHSGAARPVVRVEPFPARSTSREVDTKSCGRFGEDEVTEGVALTEGDELGSDTLPLDGDAVGLAMFSGGSTGARNEVPGEATLITRTTPV